ncbi:MAG: hypothetical protein ACXWWX_05765, partial [Actinomycetota bacterium]
MSDAMLRRGPLALGIGLLVVIVAMVAWEPRSGAGFWCFVGFGGGMAGRSAAIDGDLTIESAPGAGTRVAVTIA